MTTVKIFLVMLVLPPCSTVAQTAARSFHELRRQDAIHHSGGFWSSDVLKEGDTVWITYAPEGDTEYRKTEAKFVFLTDSTISVEGRFDAPSTKTTLDIVESRVRRIERRRKDSLFNGAFVGGAGTAASLGWLYTTADRVNKSFTLGNPQNVEPNCCSTNAVLWIAGLIGAGAGIGALVDAIIRPPRELVYLSEVSTERTVAFSLSPILSKDRKGVGLSVRW